MRVRSSVMLKSLKIPAQPKAILRTGIEFQHLPKIQNTPINSKCHRFINRMRFSFSKSYASRTLLLHSWVLHFTGCQVIIIRSWHHPHRIPCIRNPAVTSLLQNVPAYYVENWCSDPAWPMSRDGHVSYLWGLAWLGCKISHLKWWHVAATGKNFRGIWEGFTIIVINDWVSCTSLLCLRCCLLQSFCGCTWAVVSR